MIPVFTYCLCLFALQVLIWRLTRSRLYRVALTFIAVLVATGLAGVAIFVTMWLMGADLSKSIVLRPAGPWLMFGLISATVAAVGRAAKRGADGPVERAAKALKLGRTGTRASNELTSILPQLAGIRERLVYLKRQTPSDDEASTTIREQAIAELSNEANSLVERLASLLQPCGIDALAALDQLADAFTNERYQGASSATEISTSARIAVVKEYFLQRGPACQRAQSEVLSEAGALLELRLDMEQLRASSATSDSRGKASFVLSSRIAVELAKRPDSHKDLHQACKQKLSRQQGALVSSIAKYRTSASPALIQDLTESLERMRLPPSTTPCDAANHCLAQLKLEVSGRLLGRHLPNPSESDARHYRIGWIILTVICASVALIIFLIAQNSTS